MVTIKSISVEEFQKHFHRMPVDYTAPSGKQYTTFICSLDAFNQLNQQTDANGVPLNPEKVYTSKDLTGNRICMKVRPYNDPKGQFKMISIMQNKTTGENIALIAA